MRKCFDRHAERAATEARRRLVGVVYPALRSEKNVRHAALSELANGKRANVHFSHLEKIADALNISDIREIVDLVDTGEE